MQHLFFEDCLYDEIYVKQVIIIALLLLKGIRECIKLYTKEQAPKGWLVG